jgi:hypothetical protein
MRLTNHIRTQPPRLSAAVKDLHITQSNQKPPIATPPNTKPETKTEDALQPIKKHEPTATTNQTSYGKPHLIA